MKRLLLILLLLPTSLEANSKWFGAYTSGTLSAGTRYLPPSGGNVQNGTETSSHQIIPTGGTIGKLYVLLSVAPANGGGTQTVTTTLRINAADSTLTCPISEAATTCSDLTHFPALAAGDRVAVQKTDTNTPALGKISFMFEFVPTIAEETILMGGTGGTNVTTGTRYHRFMGSVGDAATENQKQIILPSTGSVKKVYVRFTAAVGADTTFTVRINTAACSSSITFTVLSGAQTGNETATTCPVTAEDRIALQTVSAGTPGTSLAFGIVYIPAAVGLFALPASTENNLNTGSANYLPVVSSGASSLTETDVQSMFQIDFRLTAVFMRITTAAGAAKQWDFALRQNAGAPSTTFAATISGAAAVTTSVTGANFTPTADALYDTIITPTGTPSNTLVMVSYLGNIPAAGGSGSMLLLKVGE